MNKQIAKYYRRFRQTGGGIVGESALWALRHAKTLHTFRTLEDQGLVRMSTAAEIDSYFDVYGEPDTEREREEICRILDRDGCWYVFAEYLSPDTGEWETADGIGMCTGYRDPTSPFENCYVPGMMREAVERLAAESPDYSFATAA